VVFEGEQNRTLVSLRCEYNLFYDPYLTRLFQPGVRVTVFLKDVPKEALGNTPIVVFALLQHEHKVSVQNFTVQRNTEYGAVVRSKVGLICLVISLLLIWYAIGPPYYVHWTSTNAM